MKTINSRVTGRIDLALGYLGLFLIGLIGWVCDRLPATSTLYASGAIWSGSTRGLTEEMMLQETPLHALDRCAVQHRSQFLATARRVLGDSAAAQDAVQDAMLSAARNLHRFRGDSQLSTWLGRIVINAALTRRRALRRRPEESLDTLLERGAAQVGRQSSSPGADVSHQSPGRRHASFASTGPSQERTLLRAEITSMLRSAVDRLPNDYRTVVILRHYEDHHVAEIASRLQITQNAVKLRLLRAHRALRSQLAERGCVITIR